MAGPRQTRTTPTSHVARPPRSTTDRSDLSSERQRMSGVLPNAFFEQTCPPAAPAAERLLKLTSTSSVWLKSVRSHQRVRRSRFFKAFLQVIRCHFEVNGH